MIQCMVQMPETGAAEEIATEASLESLYHLILLDDNDHTYQYVVEMLGRIFGYGKDKAFAIAAQVDNGGHSIVETVAYDTALKHQLLVHAYGADPRIDHSVGSMSAVLEEAP